MIHSLFQTRKCESLWEEKKDIYCIVEVIKGKVTQLAMSFFIAASASLPFTEPIQERRKGRLDHHSMHQHP